MTDATPTDIATDAWVFGLPQIILDATKEATGGVTNQFMHNLRLPTADDRVVVRLNVDTLYSSVWIDTSEEPQVFQVPAMEDDRYWIAQIMDFWTNTIQNPSSVNPQTAPDEAGYFTYLVTGPGWSGDIPDGLTHLPMPTNLSWMIVRAQVDGSDDVARVNELQKALRIAPLSTWRTDSSATADGVLLEPDRMSSNPAGEVAALDGTAFFSKLNETMIENPPKADDAAALARFSTLGIGPGATVDADPAVLNEALKQGQARIAQFQNPHAHMLNGWFTQATGTYGTDYDLRAYIAVTGLGNNLPSDAKYYRLGGDGDRDGTPRRFTLHFEPGQLPPVDAFWSLTAYDPENFFVKNSANIFAIGHLIPVTTNDDGSADLVIQAEDPGESVPEGNWLPIAPEGPFALSLRLYAPQSAAVSNDWTPPPLEEA